MQNHLGGVAALLVHHRQLYVAEQSEQHEYAGEVQVIGVEIGHNLGAYRVHDVANERHAGRNRDGFVDESQAVAACVLPRRLARLIHSEHVVTPFGKAQEQRQQECHEHNPAAQHDVGGLAARYDAQHEAETDDADVENGVAFELDAVAQIHAPIEEDDASHHPRVVLQHGENAH